MSQKIEVYGAPDNNQAGLLHLAELGVQALALDDGTTEEATTLYTLDDAHAVDAASYHLHIGGQAINPEPSAPDTTPKRPTPSGGCSL